MARSEIEPKKVSAASAVEAFAQRRDLEDTRALGEDGHLRLHRPAIGQAAVEAHALAAGLRRRAGHLQRQRLDGPGGDSWRRPRRATRPAPRPTRAGSSTSAKASAQVCPPALQACSDSRTAAPASGNLPLLCRRACRA